MKALFLLGLILTFQIGCAPRDTAYVQKTLTCTVTTTEDGTFVTCPDGTVAAVLPVQAECPVEDGEDQPGNSENGHEHKED